MTEIIKNLLFYTALCCGSTMLIGILIYGSFKALCLILDTFKTADVLRQALFLYIKQKNQITIMKPEDINIRKMGIERKRSELDE